MTRSFRRISLSNPDPELVHEDMGAKSVSFFVHIWPVFVDLVLIDDMKQVSAERGNRNVRVCLHSGPDAPHHDMVILEHGGNYFPPHRHPGKAETFHVVEGELGLVSYNEQGEAVEAGIIRKGEVYRLAVELYHLVTPMTDIVVYHEAKPGPFRGDKDLILPDWRPDADDADAISAFMKDAHALLREHGSAQ